MKPPRWRFLLARSFGILPILPRRRMSKAITTVREVNWNVENRKTHFYFVSKVITTTSTVFIEGRDCDERSSIKTILSQKNLLLNRFQVLIGSNSILDAQGYPIGTRQRDDWLKYALFRETSIPPAIVTTRCLFNHFNYSNKREQAFHNLITLFSRSHECDLL